MKKLIYTFLGILIIGCGSKNIPVKKFYFPYSQCIAPKVYAYKSNTDSSYMYLCLRTEVQNADTIFGIHIFNNECKLTNILFNQITDEGVRLKKVIFFSPGNNTGTEYTITKDEVMNWTIKPAEKLYVSFEAKDSAGISNHQVLLEKTFTRKKADLEFMDKTYPCIPIQELSTNNLQEENSTRTDLEQRTCYYAEGLGMIRMEITMNDGSVQTKHLEKIMDFKEWEDLRISKIGTVQTEVH